MLRTSLFSLSALAAGLLGMLVPQALAATDPINRNTLVDVQGPVTHLGEYDLATQSFAASGGADGGVVVYNNINFLGQAAIIGPGVVIMDWGTLSAMGNNQITDMQLGYITTNPGPVDLLMRIHAGATGGGDLGTIVVELTVAGLPGSASGGFEAFVFDIDLAANGFDAFVADGPIGYSYEPLSANTGPLLVGPPNAPGVVDLVDLYLSDATFLQSNDLMQANASLYCQLSGQEPPECHLVLGQSFGPGEATFIGSGHEFLTQVGPITQTYPVLLDEIPEFVIWDPPAALRSSTYGLMGGLGGLLPQSFEPAEPWFFSAQVVMWNPGVFPGNPEQYTQGLAVAVMPDGQVYSQPYGVSDGGLALWAETDWNDEGQKVLRLPFSIPGF